MFGLWSQCIRSFISVAVWRKFRKFCVGGIGIHPPLHPISVFQIYFCICLGYERRGECVRLLKWKCSILKFLEYCYVHMLHIFFKLWLFEILPNTHIIFSKVYHRFFMDRLVLITLSLPLTLCHSLTHSLFSKTNVFGN